MMTMSIAIMFAFVAAGVFLFFYVGNVQESYTVLLKKGKEKQPAMSSKKTEQFAKGLSIYLVVTHPRNLSCLFIHNLLLGNKLDHLDSFRHWF